MSRTREPRDATDTLELNAIWMTDREFEMQVR